MPVPYWFSLALLASRQPAIDGPPVGERQRCESGGGKREAATGTAREGHQDLHQECASQQIETQGRSYEVSLGEI